MTKENIFVVTGGPGFGKTTLVQELEQSGFSVGKELSRDFIIEQMKTGGKFLPWENRLGYSEIMLQKRIEQYEKISENEINFLDRGIPDLIAYMIKDGIEVPEFYYDVAKKYKYNKTIFLTPPWEEIYINDNERKESFEEAEVIHEAIKNTYQSLGYICIDVPKKSVRERVEFISEEVNKF